MNTPKQIIANLREIVANDALQHEGYVTRIVAAERQHAVCGGRNACLLGSTWLAAGIQPTLQSYPFVPGVFEEDREEFLARPENASLKTVYDALNAAAKPRVMRYLNREGRGYQLYMYSSHAEHYFEHCYPSKRSIKTLLDRVEAVLDA